MIIRFFTIQPSLCYLLFNIRMKKKTSPFIRKKVIVNATKLLPLCMFRAENSIEMACKEPWLRILFSISRFQRWFVGHFLSYICTILELHACLYSGNLLNCYVRAESNRDIPHQVMQYAFRKSSRCQSFCVYKAHLACRHCVIQLWCHKTLWAATNANNYILYK